MSYENRQFRLAARPVGLPKASDWDFVTEPARAPAQGEALIGVEYLSLDPAMRGWMNEGKSYIPPVKIGEVMRALGVGRVLESKAEGFAAMACFLCSDHAAFTTGTAINMDGGATPVV